MPLNYTEDGHYAWYFVVFLSRFIHFTLSVEGLTPYNSYHTYFHKAYYFIPTPSFMFLLDKPRRKKSSALPCIISCQVFSSVIFTYLVGFRLIVYFIESRII